MAYEVVIESFNVNSKTLCDEICKEIDVDLTSEWYTLSDSIHRMFLLDRLDELMGEFQEKKQISQYNIIMDERNNTEERMNMGIMNLELSYKQQHCVNTTTLSYKITQYYTIGSESED